MLLSPALSWLVVTPPQELNWLEAFWNPRCGLPLLGFWPPTESCYGLFQDNIPNLHEALTLLSWLDLYSFIIPLFVVVDVFVG